MNLFLQRIGQFVLPWLTMALFFCLFIVGLVFLSYLLMIGALIILITVAISYFRIRIAARRNATTARTHGRTIDHQD